MRDICVCHEARCRAACPLHARHPDLDVRDGAQLYASLLASLPLQRPARALAPPGAPRSPRPAPEGRAPPHPAAAPAQVAAAGGAPRAGARVGQGAVHTRVGAQLGMRLSLAHAPHGLRPPPAPPAASGVRELPAALAGPARASPKPGACSAAGALADGKAPQAADVSRASNPAGDLAAGGSKPQAVSARLAAGAPAPDPESHPAACGHESAGTVLQPYLAHVNALDSPEITLWLQLGLHAERPPEQQEGAPAGARSGERQAGAAGVPGDPAPLRDAAASTALFGVEVAFVSEAALRRALADPEILSECGLSGMGDGGTSGKVLSLPKRSAAATGTGSDAARVSADVEAPQWQASRGGPQGPGGQHCVPSGSESPGAFLWDHAERLRGAWASVGAVRVPHLSAQAYPSPDSDQTPGLSPVVVPLRLAPAAALPDALLPTARFTDAAGVHGVAKLAPLALRLAHLLTPAPLPQSLAGRSAEVLLAPPPLCRCVVGANCLHRRGGRAWQSAFDAENTGLASVRVTELVLGQGPDKAFALSVYQQFSLLLHLPVCLQVFDALWADLSAHEAAAAAPGGGRQEADNKTLTESAADPPAEPGWLSLRALDLAPAAAEAAFRAALGPFCAGEGVDPPAEPPELVTGLVPPGPAVRFVRALCFLPPRQHLLLRLELPAREPSAEGRAVPGGQRGFAAGGPALVRVATDFGACLAWVDDLLDEVFGGAAAVLGAP